MTITRLREILERYEALGQGDKFIVVSRGDTVETWDKLDDVINGNWERTSKYGGRFTYDLDSQDGEGCNAIWLAETL